MDLESGVFIVGVMLFIGAVFVFGGVNLSEAPMAMPGYLRMPLSLVLAGTGAFLVQWTFRQMWREGNVFVLLIMIGVLMYLGYGVVSYL